MYIQRALLVFFGMTLCCAAFAQDSDGAQPVHPARAPVGVAPGYEVIYSNLPGDPSAAVPGLPGVSFSPGSGNANFDRVYGSPTGNWVLTAFTDLPAAEDEILLLNGTVMVREGTAATWTNDELVGALDGQIGVNDAGSFVFSTNTDGVASADEYIVSGSSGGLLTAVAQEGGSADPPLSGAFWGSVLESAVIASDGAVGFASDVTTGLPTAEDDLLVLGTTLLAQTGVTVPPGQTGSEFWEAFDLSDFWITPDGQHYLVQGDLGGDTAFDDVVVLDGNVIVQEGTILPGSGFVEAVDLNGIVGVHLAPSGRYLVRGNNNDEADWVYSDGQVIARTGAPIAAGAAELWSDAEYSDCFFLHVGNGNGDFVIGGVTDAATDANAVLVYNNETVVAREGDPIDLDGNGLFDDDLFLQTFGNDDAFLADDGALFIVVNVKNGAGTGLGQAFLSLRANDRIFRDGFDAIP